MLPLDGVLILDKWAEVSSNAALQHVRRLFAPDKKTWKALKVGHTGTLDPLATGMLILCFGRATRFSQFLLNADKTYTVDVALGVKTTTGDREGEITFQYPEPLPEWTQSALEAAVHASTGDIIQIPSMYSALKYQGKPLYEWAREGKEVPRTPRQVRIHWAHIQQFDPQAHRIQIALRCSKGTYVRTWAEDLGDKLGVGAHVHALRRTAIGNFNATEMYTLADLEAMSYAERYAALLPVSCIVQNWERVDLDDITAFYMQRGQAIQWAHAPVSGLVQVYHRSGAFLGVGHILDDGRIAPMCMV